MYFEKRSKKVGGNILIQFFEPQEFPFGIIFVTQHRTVAGKVIVSVSGFVYHQMFRLLPNGGLVGSLDLERTKNCQTSTLAPKFTFKKIFLTSAPLPPSKKLVFLQIQFSNRDFQILFPTSISVFFC